MTHLVITGASVGIGKHTALGLASTHSRMTLIGRDREKHGDVMSQLASLGVEAQLIECDLASLDAVGATAERVRTDSHHGVDVIVANAGIGGQRGVTQDGFEIHFGVNHLAHHLLITELADRVADRVVIVSSNAHYESEGLDLDSVQRSTRTLTGFAEYRDSKLANVLAGREMGRRYPFATHIVHPGVTATAIWRRIPWPIRPLFTRRMAGPQEGADTPVWAVTTPGLQSGGYYARRTLRTPSERAMDDEAARDLWDRSEEWVARHRRSP